MQPGDGFAIYAAQLIISPAGNGQMVGIFRREFEFDLAGDGKRLSSFRDFLLEPVVQIVMIGMVPVFKWVQRIIIVDAHLTRKFSRAEVPGAGKRKRFRKSKRGGTDPARHPLTIAQCGSRELRDQGLIGNQHKVSRLIDNF